MSDERPVVVILAGGSGTRFWPASTRIRPKQFLHLLGPRSLLQESYDRARMLAPPERVLVLTSEGCAGLVREQLPEIPAANVVGEPARRDTAAAVCLGALLARALGGDGPMVVLTADHRIHPVQEFIRVVLSATRAAVEDEALYTLGIPPMYPATGFGYLRRGGLVRDDAGLRHFNVREFREKPDAATAADYLQAGEYFWNSGMFVWRTDVILAAYAEHLEGHVKALQPAAVAWWRERDSAGLRAAFERLPAVSIDYAIMEKAEDVRVVEATFSWSDLGGWLAVEEFLTSDETGNRVRGRTAAVNSTGNLVFSEDEDELVALLGVEDLVVVRAAGRTLVAHRSHLEQLKDLVSRIERKGYGDDL